MSVPYLPIDHSGRKRSRIQNQNHSTNKEASFEPSSCELLSLQTLSTKACEEEKKENNDECKIENIRVLIAASDTVLDDTMHLNCTNNNYTSDTQPSKLPNFSYFPNIDLPPYVKENRDLDDQRDTSFLTQETVPESDSDSERDEIGSCICVMHSEDADSCIGITHISEEDNCSQYTSATSSSSMHSKQYVGVHFADEVGLPIQRICHYECDRKQLEYSELVVLCICPEKKTFEFLHIGYHMNEEIPTSVNDLLKNLPDLCTNQTFADAKFVALYRNNMADKGFQNLCASSAQTTAPATNNTTVGSDGGEDDCSLSLCDCDFRANELVVAAIHGSSERAVLAGIGPLLSNQRILRTLKRARRSRRGLKFISKNGCGAAEGKDGLYHRRKSRDLSVRRRKTKREIKGSDQKHLRESRKEIKGLDEKYLSALPQMDAYSGELVDEYCHDYDPLYDVAEYHTKLLLGILAISSGTVVFSALGL